MIFYILYCVILPIKWFCPALVFPRAGDMGKTDAPYLRLCHAGDMGKTDAPLWLQREDVTFLLCNVKNHFLCSISKNKQIVFIFRKKSDNYLRLFLQIFIFSLY